MRRFTNRQYALYILFAGVSYQVCGFITHYNIEPGEPIWMRATLVVPVFIWTLFLASSDWSEKFVRNVINAVIFLGTFQYLYLAQVNNMNYWFAVGLFSLVAAASIILTQKWMIIAYHMVVNFWITFVALFLPGYEDYQLLLFNLYSFTAILMVFEIEKLNLFDRLVEALAQLKVSKSNLEKNYQRNLQAAHDLGSPVSAINAVAKKLQYENPVLFRMLDSSVARINEISGELLQEHRTSKVNADADFFDLENSISRLVEDKRKEHQNEKSLFIFYRFTAPLLEEVHIPKSEFHRVISNLINNSVHATQHKVEKRIKIVVSPQAKWVEVLLSDNGSGIPAERQSEIFEKGVTYKDEGNGLGLSHAKRTVESWGGQIQLKSSGSSGTCFRIVIPYNTQKAKLAVVSEPQLKSGTSTPLL